MSSVHPTVIIAKSRVSASSTITGPSAGRSHSNGTALRRGWRSCLLSTKLSPIQFMRFLKAGEAAGLRREWLIAEIRMLQGVDSVDSFTPIKA
jgi:hypothetical protein